MSRAILICLLFVTPVQAQPNILHILVEDLGWTDTSVQIDPNVLESKSDYYQTPVLEQLAAEGMRFSNAYSSSPICTPTRAAIQTGKSPAQLQMTDNIQAATVGGTTRNTDQPLIPPAPIVNLPLEEISIAEHLKTGNPDYRTSHHQKWGLHASSVTGPLLQGYDVANTGHMVFPEGTDPKKNEGITKRAIDFIEETVAMQRPFYTQVSYPTVHTLSLIHI